MATTTQTQRTPGPWTVERDGQGNVLIGAPKPGDPARYLWVAEVTPSNNGEHDANARLIAAAPMLLEALKELDAHLDFTTRVHRGEQFPDHPDSINDAFDKARDAIEEAEDA